MALQYFRSFPSQNPATVVKQVREGANFPTQAICNVNDVNFNNKLVKAGVVEALLDHLQAPNDPFDKEVYEVAFPTVWINALMNLLNQGNVKESLAAPARLLTVQRIGPLLEVMADFETRTLFQEKDLWCAGVLFFTGLLNNLCLSPATEKDLREQHSPVLEMFLVQTLFMELHQNDAWRDVQDAQRRSRCHPITDIESRNSAARTVQELLDVPKNGMAFTAEGVEYMRTFASIPVGPGTFATEFSFLMKSCEFSKDSYDSVRYIFQQLYMGLGPSVFGADGRVVGILLPACRKHLNTDLLEYDLENVRISLLQRETTGTRENLNPSDSVSGAAIADGVIELCIDALIQQPVAEGVLSILQVLSHTTFQGNTAKALRKRAPLIRIQLEKLKKQRKNLDIVNAIESMIAHLKNDEDASRALVECHFCKQGIPTANGRRCSACRRAIYCSRECQKRDWREGGHKKACNSMKTMDVQGLEAGKSEKQARRAGKAETNLSIAGNQLFTNNIPKIMLQCSLRNVRVIDIIVWLDFTAIPPKIGIMEPEEFFEGIDEQARRHNSGIFERNRRNGSITAACCNGAEVLLKSFLATNAPTIVMHHREEVRWVEAQKLMVPLGMDLVSLRRDRAAYDEMMEELATPGPY